MKPQKQKHANGVRGRPFEKEIDIEALVEFRDDNQKTGAYLLANPKRPQDKQYVFGFTCEGWHITTGDDQLIPDVERFKSTLISFQKGESLTVYRRQFADDSTRQAELAELRARAPTREAQYMVLSEQAKAQQLTRAGRRTQGSLHFMVTVTLNQGSLEQEGAIGKLLQPVERFLTSMLETEQGQQRADLHAMLWQAFRGPYKQWQQTLSTTQGLAIHPMDARQMWEFIWRQLHRSPPAPLPPLLVVDQNGLREEGASQKHIKSHLLKGGGPQARPDHVKCGNDYIGIITLEDKPGGWASPAEQARYLPGLLALPGMTDVESVTQIRPADSNVTKAALTVNMKQGLSTDERAKEQGSIDVAAQQKTDETLEAKRLMYKGAVPMHVSNVIKVYRSTLEALNEDCQRIESYFPAPAWFSRERHAAWIFWPQTLPIVRQRLGHIPGLRDSLLFLNNEVMGFVPMLTVRGRDKTGFELLAEAGGEPVLIDLYNKLRNLGIFATTRAGKSVLISGVLAHAIAHEIPVLIVDYPRPDGTSTFTDFTKFYGEAGAYIDVQRQHINLFDRPDMRGVARKVAKERLKLFKEFVFLALQTLVIGNKSASDLRVSPDAIRSILKLALKEFFQDACIARRYQDAEAAGMGSEAWAKSPVLADFLTFCSGDYIDLQEDEDLKGALSYIRLRLRSWIADEGIGQAISRPSTVNSNSMLTVFAMTNVNDEEEASIIAIAALSAALRKALASPKSFFFIDEAPILFKFASISALIGRLCANGAKAGIRVLISAQDPDTIAQSPNGAQILQNLNTRLVGRIQPTAIKSFEEHLAYPKSVIARNAGESFFPNAQELCSHWLLDDNGRLTWCRYYAPEALLGLTANNPDEQAARTVVMARFPDQPIKGLAVFSRLLAQAIQSGESITDVVEQWASTTP